MTISIRRATPDDAEQITALWNDPSVLAGTLQLPYPLISTWRDRLAQTDGTVTLVACADDGIAGSIGLHPNLRHPRRAHAAALGLGVATPWQRKGVGSALLAAVIELADNWYGFARLELDVYVDNVAAIALYKKFGFEAEGTLRAYALRHGELVDTLVMGRLRPRPQPR